ncbi:MAG: hypothetical protein MI746_09810, partial [Pseudomonadales bacterium]|nr:hypothetical protein [Pseudomonadales bacterium]
MKKLVLVLSLGSALLLSQSAFADGRFYNRGFHGGFNDWGYNRSFRSGFYRSGFNRPFRRGSFYGTYGPYRHYGYRGNVINFNYGNFGPGWGYGWGPYRYRNWG